MDFLRKFNVVTALRCLLYIFSSYFWPLDLGYMIMTLNSIVKSTMTMYAITLWGHSLTQPKISRLPCMNALANKPGLCNMSMFCGK